jgi:hypothetical protein
MHVNARHKHLASHGRLEGNLKQRLIDCYLPRPSPSGRRRNSVGFFELERESARVVHQHFSHHTDRLARTLAPPTCSTVSNSFRCALFVGASHFIGRSNSRNRRVPTGRLKLIAAAGLASSRSRPGVKNAGLFPVVPVGTTPVFATLQKTEMRPLFIPRCSLR